LWLQGWWHADFAVFLMRNNRAMEKKPKARHLKSTVRLPGPLHEAIREAAAINDHSMNDEIIQRLQLYPIATRLDEIEQQNAELKRMVQRLIDRSN
jgi:predicted HicB family RNase H-like nuclease